MWAIACDLCSCGRALPVETAVWHGLRFRDIGIANGPPLGCFPAVTGKQAIPLPMQNHDGQWLRARLLCQICAPDARGAGNDRQRMARKVWQEGQRAADRSAVGMAGIDQPAEIDAIEARYTVWNAAQIPNCLLGQATAAGVGNDEARSGCFVGEACEALIQRGSETGRREDHQQGMRSTRIVILRNAHTDRNAARRAQILCIGRPGARTQDKTREPRRNRRRRTASAPSPNTGGWRPARSAARGRGRR